MNPFELKDVYVLPREASCITDLGENLYLSDWKARTSGKPLREHESHHSAEGDCVGAPSPVTSNFHDEGYYSRNSTIVEQLSRRPAHDVRTPPSGDSGYYEGESGRRLRPKRSETPDTPGDHEGRPISRINMPVGLEGLENPREEFLDKVFGENEAFTSRSPTTPTESGDSSNRSQSNTTPPSSLTPTTDGYQGPQKSYKRKRGSDEEEEGSPPDRPRKQGKTRPSDIYGQERNRGRRFACHFHLLQKEMYCKNKRTGKRYETCSGPGWSSMHHLKQHLGNSAGSVHKKIRCPRCLKAFKTASAVLKHQKDNPPDCLQQPASSPAQQSTFDQDDINETSWERIETEISRQGFNRLVSSKQRDIDLWVSNNLDDQTKPLQVEERKWELRKWNMTWTILFPDHTIPSSPFYDDDAFMSLTNTELLVKSFEETLDLRNESGDIEGIDGEMSDKLKDCLRVAISVAAISNKQKRDLVRRRLLDSSLAPEEAGPSQGISEDPFQGQVALPKSNMPISKPSTTSRPTEPHQNPEVHGRSHSAGIMNMVQNSDQSSLQDFRFMHLPTNEDNDSWGGNPFMNNPLENQQQFFDADTWDQYDSECNAICDQLLQNSSTSFFGTANAAPIQVPQGEIMTPILPWDQN